MLGEEMEPAEERTRGQLFPLNSRRLTASILGRIASDLGVPGGGSLADTRQMVEGALDERGRPPQNVLVNLLETEEGVAIRLEDGDGIFLEVSPTSQEPAGEGSATGDGGQGDGMAGEDNEVRGGGPGEEERAASEPGGAQDRITELEDEVSRLSGMLEREHARVEFAAELEVEVRSLRAKLEDERAHFESELAQEKTKYRELWKKHCSSSSRDEKLIAEQVREMAELRSRLAECGRGHRAPEYEEGLPRDREPVGVTAGHARVDSPLVPEPLPDEGHPRHIASAVSPRSERTRRMPVFSREHTPLGRTAPGSGDASARAYSLSEAARVEPVTRSMTSDPSALSPTSGPRPSSATQPRRGKAPPIETFSGESNSNFEDWMPALERCALWNAWSEEETLLQLAGHLRGRALEEWNLMEDCDKRDLTRAKLVLRKRLDPGSKMLAAQDFRRASQQRGEPVADYIRRLERAFRQAYGADGMSPETRAALLFGQMQEGLKFELMESPAVSGAVDYKQLCLSARNEEKRLVELEKRRMFLQSTERRHRPAEATSQHTTPTTRPTVATDNTISQRATSLPPAGDQSRGVGSRRTTGTNQPIEERRCYRCNEPGHLARDCSAPGGSVTNNRWNPTKGRGGSQPGSSNQVSTMMFCPANYRPSDLALSVHDCLYQTPTERGSDVLEVRIRDKGSRPQRVSVLLQGVPVSGVVDSGSDITIVNGPILKRVATIAKLRSGRLKKVNKVPRGYDGQPFALHGRIDLDVSFEGITMQTPVYIKLDAAEPLLLSEGVCRQLRILSYHPGVVGHTGVHETCVRSPTSEVSQTPGQPSNQASHPLTTSEATQERGLVPVRVEEDPSSNKTSDSSNSQSPLLDQAREVMITSSECEDTALGEDDGNGPGFSADQHMEPTKSVGMKKSTTGQRIAKDPEGPTKPASAMRTSSDCKTAKSDVPTLRNQVSSGEQTGAHKERRGPSTPAESRKPRRESSVTAAAVADGRDYFLTTQQSEGVAKKERAPRGGVTSHQKLEGKWTVRVSKQEMEETTQKDAHGVSEKKETVQRETKETPEVKHPARKRTKENSEQDEAADEETETLKQPKETQKGTRRAPTQRKTARQTLVSIQTQDQKTKQIVVPKFWRTSQNAENNSTQSQDEQDTSLSVTEGAEHGSPPLHMEPAELDTTMPVDGMDRPPEDRISEPEFQVRLLQSVRLPPRQSKFARVRVEGEYPEGSILLVEQAKTDPDAEALLVQDLLMEPVLDKVGYILLANPVGFTQSLPEGAIVASASPVVVEGSAEDDDARDATQVWRVTFGRQDGDLEEVQWRKSKLESLLEEPDLPQREKTELLEFLSSHHHIFSLAEGERGETSLVRMEINTGDAQPKKQQVRRMPPAVRQEVARQLEKMQREGVIEPSNSPWASPVVLVRKRDGSHRFCVDYRQLNSVTVPDSFPLPRIDDLLDQLGDSKYFSTIDLASGFWQVRLHQSAKEKTAFVVPQGLFEFRVMPFGLTNAPGVFQRLMQRVLAGLNPLGGPEFVSVYLDDILIFSRTLKEHLQHLRAVFARLMEAGLKLKPVKCHFARSELEYLGHVITRRGLKTNPRLIEAVKEFPTPTNVHEVRQFLGLASYYRRFIGNFAKLANPLHYLTRRDSQWLWTGECESAFQKLKELLTTAPVLAYPNFHKEYVLETDASTHGLGAVLSQEQADKKLHPVAYASRALSSTERNYGITELETLAVVWSMSHFHHFLYGNKVTVLTDHSSVKAVLESPNPTAKHARWWTRVYGRGVREVKLCYRAGRENKGADALSRSPQLPAPAVGTVDGELQVSMVTITKDVNQEAHPANTRLPDEIQCSGDDPTDGSEGHAAGQTKTVATVYPSEEQVVDDATVRSGNWSRFESQVRAGDGGEWNCVETEMNVIPTLEDPLSKTGDSVEARITQIELEPPPIALQPTSVYDLRGEQEKDPAITEVKEYLTNGTLPQDPTRSRKLVLQTSQYSLIDGVVYHKEPRLRHMCAVAPRQLQEELLRVTHAGKFSGHFSGPRLFKTLRESWWWETMLADAEKFARTCPACVIATGTGRRCKPVLHPIPVQKPFQVLGIDIMDLPVTEKGNRHVVVIQDLFTKWPMVFPVPDQKSSRIAQLVAEEVVPLFGVPESLLSDRGTNLLSRLVLDLCRLLGISKLNTTAHHPQCDGAVERFNRTLKTMLRKHAAQYGNQWDTYLAGVLWAYRNTPHSSTGEKPSFLLFGVDLRSPTEAAFMPITNTEQPTDQDDYREQLMMMLRNARDLAVANIRRAQHRYKQQYDKHARPTSFRLGRWVFVRFPQDESGRLRKLSRPWRGPYRVVDVKDPDVTVVKVYHPQHGEMRVHQSRVCLSPDNFPAGFYWYGGKQKGPGRPPKWVERFLSSRSQGNDTDEPEEPLGCDAEQETTDQVLTPAPADTQEKRSSSVEPDASTEANQSGVTGPNPGPSSVKKQKQKQRRDALQGRSDQEKNTGSSGVPGPRESEGSGSRGEVESEEEHGTRLRRTVKPPERFM